MGTRSGIQWAPELFGKHLKLPPPKWTISANGEDFVLDFKVSKGRELHVNEFTHDTCAEHDVDEKLGIDLSLCMNMKGCESIVEEGFTLRFHFKLSFTFFVFLHS